METTITLTFDDVVKVIFEQIVWRKIGINDRKTYYAVLFGVKALVGKEIYEKALTKAKEVYEKHLVWEKEITSKKG